MPSIISSLIESSSVAYRSIIFGVDGYFKYTKQAYEKASETFTPGALEVDLSQKVAIVTGANAGLGDATALELARRGATVHLLCRSRESAEAARDRIVKETKNSKVFVQLVDISRPLQIKKFADEFAKQSGKLDMLVNNAGVLLNERRVTDDGLEATFATNTLGSYYLTKKMLPLLEKSDDPRVIMVSSAGMYNKRLDASDLQAELVKPWNGPLVYAQTKRQQVELTSYFAKIVPSMRFLSMHPGWSDTPGVATSLSSFHAAMLEKLRTPAQGADTIVWAAIANESRNVPNGAFLLDRKEVGQHVVGSNTIAPQGEIERLVEKMDDILARITGEKQN